MNNNKTVLWGLLPSHVSWLTIVLALLAIITFFAISNPSVQYATRMGIGGGVMEYANDQVSSPPSVGAPMSPDYYPYPYPNPDVPVTDTREFLKVYYNASMQTRDVPALTRRVETTVRGYDGRIDNESSSEKYGYVSFALPQIKYDAFRIELESLVGSRFLKLNISSQNFLPQKVSIEEQQKHADTALADYKTARQKIVSAYTSAVQSLQAKIAAATSSERVSLELQLARESVLYTRNVNNADANIKYAQDWQKAVQTQDAKLLANVETVSGTVSVRWIGLWDIALLYLPGYWIPTIFAILTLISYRKDRSRQVSST